jgi:hypothetical protein
MDPRRIRGHLREHNWLAVAIEFVIVVAGVFVGIQVSNWNEDRVESGRARAYLARIQRDLESEASAIRKGIEYYEQVLAYARQALAYAEEGKLVEESPWKTVLAFYQAGQVYPHVASDATYREMTSAGDLRLIGSQKLGEALSFYYATRGDSGQLFDEFPAYRESIRGLTPSSVQRYIWTRCYREDLLEHRMIDCPAPIPEAEAQAILLQFMAEPQLIRQLRYWETQATILKIVSANELEAAAGLAGRVARELAR